MLTNPGFTFWGMSGEHKIVPTSETDLQSWGSIYDEAVVCVYPKGLVNVYENGPGYSYTSEHSVAMEFASINIDDNAAILSFCDKYGMPGSMRQEANFTNDYLFFDETKDNFTQAVPFGVTRERTWLGQIKKDITLLNLTLRLSQAISDKDFKRIVEIVIFVCFDLSNLDFEKSERKTETFEFNHYFHRYTELHGIKPFFDEKESLWTDSISDFLDDIDDDVEAYEFYSNIGLPYDIRYPKFLHALWEALYDLFRGVLSYTNIESIGPFGNVTFTKPIDSFLNSLNQRDKEIIIKIAKGILSDIFKEKLNRVFPEIVFTKRNMPESSWRIPSLLDAMYLEVFFTLTPSSSIRHCANPTCNQFFTWSASKKSRIYCSQSCADAMAHRKFRERQKNENPPRTK